MQHTQVRRTQQGVRGPCQRYAGNAGAALELCERGRRKQRQDLCELPLQVKETYYPLHPWQQCLQRWRKAHHKCLGVQFFADVPEHKRYCLQFVFTHLFILCFSLEHLETRLNDTGLIGITTSLSSNKTLTHLDISRNNANFCVCVHLPSQFCLFREQLQWRWCQCSFGNA